MPLLLAQQQQFNPTATADVALRGLGLVASFTNAAAEDALQRSKLSISTGIEQQKNAQDAFTQQQRLRQEDIVNARLQADLQLRQDKYAQELQIQRGVDQFRRTTADPSAYAPSYQPTGGGGGGSGNGGGGSATFVQPDLPVAADNSTPVNPVVIDSADVDTSDTPNGIPVDGGAPATVPVAGDQPAPGSVLPPPPGGAPATPAAAPASGPGPGFSGGPPAATSQEDYSSMLSEMDKKIQLQSAIVRAAGTVPGKQGMAQQKQEQNILNQLNNERVRLLDQQRKASDSAARAQESAAKNSRAAALAPDQQAKASADAAIAAQKAKELTDTEAVRRRKLEADAASAEEEAKIKANKAANGNTSKPTLTQSQVTTIQREKDTLDREIADELDAQNKISAIEQKDPTYRDAPPAVRGMLNKTFGLKEPKGDAWIKQAQAQSKALQARLQEATTSSSTSGTQGSGPAQPPQQNGPSGDGQKSAFDWLSQ